MPGNDFSMILELILPATANKQPRLLCNNLILCSASNTGPFSPPAFLTGKFPDLIIHYWFHWMDIMEILKVEGAVNINQNSAHCIS